MIADMILESLKGEWSGIEYGRMKKPVTWTNDSTRLNETNLNSLSDSIRELQYIADKNETAAKEAIKALCDNMTGRSFGDGKGEIFNDYENNTANGKYAHAEGIYTKASSEGQHVQGKHNIEDINGTYAHILGNGDNNKKSNAHTIDWEGNAWFSGDLKIGGTSYDDTNAKILATTEYVDTATATLQDTLNNTLAGVGDSVEIIEANREAIQNLPSLVTDIGSLTAKVTELENIIKTLVSAGTEDPNVTDPGTAYYIRYEE